MIFFDNNLQLCGWKNFNTNECNLEYDISNNLYDESNNLNSPFSNVGHSAEIYLCKKILNLHNGAIEFNNSKEINSFPFQFGCYFSSLNKSIYSILQPFSSAPRAVALIN